MVNYIIRVVFPLPDADSYQRLTAELAKFGIGDAIRADDAIGYRLPLGQYCYSGNEPINEVRDAIHRLAHTIQAAPSVLVTEVNTVSWSGLEVFEG